MSIHPSIEDLEIDLDATLDRLLQNAEVLEEIKPHKKTYETEMHALQNLQESLLSHLINLDDLMQKESKHLYNKKNLREKMMRYSEIDPSILETVSERFKLHHDQRKLRKNRIKPSTGATNNR